MEYQQDGYDRFEAVLQRSLGDKMRSDEAFGIRLYSSLTNVRWTDPDGAMALYSFRSAGSLIARIAGRGCYLDWYMSGPFGQPDDEIVARLALKAGGERCGDRLPR